MSTPLEFLHQFRDLLRAGGIRFAITSGMACADHGLQSNTKDSDGMIVPGDPPDLHALLLGTNGASRPPDAKECPLGTS